MLTTVCLVAIYIASLALIAKVSERWPSRLARLAFLPAGGEVRLPLPSTALALLEPAPDGKTTYREAPPRKLALAAFPGALRVSEAQTDLAFLPERNCVVVRRRPPGRAISALVVRVDVSLEHECLRLRARYLPMDDVFFLAILTVVVPGHQFSRGASVRPRPSVRGDDPGRRRPASRRAPVLRRGSRRDAAADRGCRSESARVSIGRGECPGTPRDLSKTGGRRVARA